MVDLYFCNDCRKYFRLTDKHVKDGHIQDWVDCDLCGSEDGAFRIHDIKPDEQNWIWCGADICFGLPESFLRKVWEENEDGGEAGFEEWIESNDNDLFKLDMDAVREALK